MIHQPQSSVQLPAAIFLLVALKRKRRPACLYLSLSHHSDGSMWTLQHPGPSRFLKGDWKEVQLPSTQKAAALNGLFVFSLSSETSQKSPELTQTPPPSWILVVLERRCRDIEVSADAS